MKKILKDEYVKRLSEKFNNQIELVGEYTKFKEETLHLCAKCGEQFMISPETMLRRSCPCQNCSAYDPNTSVKFRETRVGAPKKTIDQYRSQLSEKFNGQIEVLSDTYNGNRNPLLHLCTKCGETFEANPFDMMRRKNACLFCGEDIYKREGRKLGSRKKTHEQIVQQLKDRWGDKVAAISEYDGNVKKMKFRCNVCGSEFWARSISLLYHYAFWCPKCAEGRNGEKRKKSDEQYLEDLKKVWGDRFTPLAPYGKNQNTPILHRCNECGNEWEVNPHNLLGGEGCPECKKVTLSTLNRKPQEQYVEELREIWGDRIILVGEYQTTETPTLHRCNKCGLEWKANPHALLARHGCPRCNMSRGELRIEKWLIEHNIKYVHNRCVFDWLVTKKGARMKPDFYLPDYNLVIEFNGLQHYESVDYFGGIETLTKTQERDKIKKELLLEHKIETFEIPYWDFDDIEDILRDLLKAA